MKHLQSIDEVSTTPERTVEEIVDEIMKNFDNEIKDFPREFVAKVFTEALQAERQKRGERVANYLIQYPEASLADYYADIALTQPNNPK